MQTGRQRSTAEILVCRQLRLSSEFLGRRGCRLLIHKILGQVLTYSSDVIEHGLAKGFLVSQQYMAIALGFSRVERVQHSRT